MDYSSSWNSPGQNTGVGSLSLLQGIFPTQGSNPGLPHCRDSLPAEPKGKGSPKVGHKCLSGRIHQIQLSTFIHCRVLCCVLVTQSCPTVCDPMDCSPTGFSVNRIFQARILGIFPTQGWNPGLLHCRWILYCLSHQRSLSSVQSLSRVRLFVRREVYVYIIVHNK